MTVQPRIRDILSSKKVFQRRVLEIYATSVHYDSGSKASQTFFVTVRNKIRCRTFFRG